MGGGSRRAAQPLGLVAIAMALGLPAAAGAVAPGGAIDDARPTLDRRAAAVGSGQAPPRVRDARAALRKRFGRQLALGVNPTTGATRVVQRLDGALTAPAAGDRRQVARSWVRANRAVLGLDAPAVDDLVVADTETSGPAGLTTVRLAQRFRGVEVFDGGVEVTLDRGGRVLAATGEPVADPAVDTVIPRLDASAAREALDAGVGPTEPVAPAELTLFPIGGDVRLAWTLIQRRSSTATYSAIVDARSGEVLFRQNLTKSAAPAAIYPNYPGAPGALNAVKRIDLEDEGLGWLEAGAPKLAGPYARAFSDVNANDLADPGEEVAPDPNPDIGFVRTFVDACPPEPAAPPDPPAPPHPMCTWDPLASNSWMENREQNAVQAFALVNRFRDHLADPKIGFGGRAGSSEGFEDNDPVEVHARDGAALQDAAHLNNANMTVYPEGRSPRMQMYLFSGQGYRAIDGGDDAATIWHEYTHGLSLRLIKHSDGTSALSAFHGRALGEGWSDFYALDKLHADGLEIDDEGIPGEVDIGAYSDATPHATRSQGADCPPSRPSPAANGALACPGTAGAGAGGYTLGDFGKVANGYEEHADGETWLQTLWDLRRALIARLGSQAAGSDAVLRLVTDGMRLTPAEPTFLEARDAILVADTAAGGAHRKLIRDVFTARGMGFYASARGPYDVSPNEDFSPSAAPQVTLGAPSRNPAPNEPIELTASVVDDTPIKDYAWDFDGDGFDERVTTEPTTTVAYAAAGEYRPRVTARDDGDVLGVGSTIVLVANPAAPVGEPPPTPTTPPPPPTIPRPIAAAKPPTLRLATTRTRRATAVVKCASRCTVRAKGTVSATMARRLGRPRRTVLALTRSVTRTSTTTLTLPLSTPTRSAARRRGLRTLSVVLDVRVTDSRGRSVTRRSTLRIAV